jgi:hypothetical protein
LNKVLDEKSKRDHPMDGPSNNNQSKISTGEDSFIFIISYNLNADKLSTLVDKYCG